MKQTGTRGWTGSAALQPARLVCEYLKKRAEAPRYFGVIALGLAATSPWLAAATQTFGLHTALEGRAGFATDASRWTINGDSTLYDLGATARPLWSAQDGAGKMNAELEINAALGDTIARNSLAAFATDLGDAADMFDLSRTWSSGARHRHSARLDRLAMSWTQPWGTFTAGRHAVTWGGGLVFNPFDLFNPFAPGDVIRDYKVGADMLHLDLPLSDGGVQMLAVGRRDVVTGDVTAGASSFAAMWQKRVGNGEYALMGAWHYDEPVLGASAAGLLGAAAWRVDGTWVRVRPPGFATTKDYVALVANVQYSWVWGGRNVFGFLEYHHNDLGHADNLAALSDPFLVTQISRRNVFLLGRDYVAASLQVELHPLVSAFVSVIVNTQDPSALLQPRVTWNATGRMQLLAGLDLPVGPRGSEFGGLDLGAPPGTTRAPTSFYVRATWDW